MSDAYSQIVPLTFHLHPIAGAVTLPPKSKWMTSPQLNVEHIFLPRAECGVSRRNPREIIWAGREGDRPSVQGVQPDQIATDGKQWPNGASDQLAPSWMPRRLMTFAAFFLHLPVP